MIVAQRSASSGASPGGGLLRETCPGGNSDRAMAVRGEGGAGDAAAGDGVGVRGDGCGVGVRGGPTCFGGIVMRGAIEVRGGNPVVRAGTGIDRECAAMTSTCLVTRSR